MSLFTKSESNYGSFFTIPKKLGAITVCGLTKAGIKYDDQPKLNQDAYFIHETQHSDKSLLTVGVFDGHGPTGERVSGMITELLPFALAKGLQGVSSLQKSNVPFVQSFREVDRMVVGYRDIDTMFSGSTGVVVATHGTSVVCANVGDSRCLLGSVTPNNQIKVKPLSNEHCPDLPLEAKRIRAAGGRIEQAVFDGERQGPLRIYKRDVDLPGLTVTRAFGDDMGKTLGVTCEPEIIQHEIEPEDRYIVLCSDGLTEFLTDAEIMESVHRLMRESGGNLMAVMESIIAESRKRWQKEEEGISDDCTMIILHIDPSLTLKGAPSADVDAVEVVSSKPPPARAKEEGVLKKGLRRLLSLRRRNPSPDSDGEDDPPGRGEEQEEGVGTSLSGLTISTEGLNGASENLGVLTPTMQRHLQAAGRFGMPMSSIAKKTMANISNSNSNNGRDGGDLVALRRQDLAKPSVTLFPRMEPPRRNSLPASASALATQFQSSMTSSANASNARFSPNVLRSNGNAGSAPVGKVGASNRSFAAPGAPSPLQTMSNGAGSATTAGSGHQEDRSVRNVARGTLPNANSNSSPTTSHSLPKRTLLSSTGGNPLGLSRMSQDPSAQSPRGEVGGVERSGGSGPRMSPFMSSAANRYRPPH